MNQNVLEKKVLKMNVKILFLIFIFLIQFIFSVRNLSAAISDSKKLEEAKRLFAMANKFLSEDKYNEAFTLAEKLIEEYPDDYQIWVYLHFYEHTFCLLDEDFRQGQLRPIPEGIQKRIEKIKTKKNKNALDFVKLSWLVQGKNNGPNEEYLKQIIDKFPNDIWAEWAKSELAMAEIMMTEENAEKIQERFYIFGKSFIKQYPKSHLIPRILRITASSRLQMKEDETTKDEAVNMLQHLLKEYPNSDYECASARQILRGLLGNEYKETEGNSVEIDKAAMSFYIHTPDISEYKNYTQKYLDLKPEALKQEVAKSSKGIYILLIPFMVIIVAGGILLYKKTKTKQL